MRVLGIDPSLTGTGLAIVNWRGRIVDHTTVKTKPIRGTDRLTYIETVVRNWLRHLEPGDVVVIEGPSYGSRTGNQHEMAGLWWILMRANVDRKNMLGGKLGIYIVAPRARAKWATGNGNADKQLVGEAIRTRYPQVDNSWDDNAIDALILAQMGRERDELDVVKEYAA